MKNDENGPSIGRRRSVLVVDDDPLMLRATARLLQGAGVELETADSAERALAILEERRHPVVVSDYIMPGLDGLQLLARVRREWPETVCLLISAHADLETVAQGINKIGLYRFVFKPCDPADLRDAILEALAHSDLLRQKEDLARALESANFELRAVNRQLDREVTRRTMDLLLALLAALDLQGTVSSEHFRRVAVFAKRLAGELGLPPDDVKAVERGALLHDVGMLAMPAFGERGTSGAEPGAAERHTVYGFEILRSLAFLGDAPEIVRHHHERFDGQGFPDGLAGDSIHIGARIVALVDAYDAMTSARGDREAMTSEEAREVILAGRGSKFDPRCVDAFERISDDDLDGLRLEVAMASDTALK